MTRQLFTLLSEGEQRLKLSGIQESKRNAELLLEYILGVSRSELYLQRSDAVSSEIAEQYEQLIQRHISGEPIQYIVGSAPFFGYEFLVGKGVFIPRFDTEAMIERMLTVFDRDISKDETIQLLDLCCGCGTIGLTIAAERKNVQVVLVDSSPVAIDYTKRNAEALGVSSQVETVQRDLLEPFPAAWKDHFHYVASNPPYIPVSEVDTLPAEVRISEPHQALTDDGDGYKFYRHFCDTVPDVLKPNGRFFVEGAYAASSTIVKILLDRFTDLTVTNDLNGIGRVVDGVEKRDTNTVFSS